MSYSQLYKGPMLYKGPWEHCILLPKVKYYLEKLCLQEQEQERKQKQELEQGQVEVKGFMEAENFELL